MIRRNGNYSINNKKFKPTELHGERFYDWFDKTFNLQPITLEVKHDTTKSSSKSEISTNINAAQTRHISEDMLGKAEGEPNKSPSNLVQEKPSDSIPQPAEDNVAGQVSPVECKQSAGFCPASHARAPFFHNPLPNPCALATPLSAGRKIGFRVAQIFKNRTPQSMHIPADFNEEPASDFALVQPLLFTTSLQSCILRGATT